MVILAVAFVSSFVISTEPAAAKEKFEDAVSVSAFLLLSPSSVLFLLSVKLSALLFSVLPVFSVGVFSLPSLSTVLSVVLIASLFFFTTFP